MRRLVVCAWIVSTLLAVDSMPAKATPHEVCINGHYYIVNPPNAPIGPGAAC